jgi:hypothetical protein
VQVAEARAVGGDQALGRGARVGGVPGVEAEVEVGFVQQPLHLVFELDEAPRVRVDDGAQPMVGRGRPRPAQRVDHRSPLRAGQPPRRCRPAGGRRALRARPVDEDEHRALRRRDGPAGALGHRLDRSGLRRVVEVLEHEGPDRGQPALAQDGAQPRRVLGQVADRSELERADAGRGDVVEDQRPGRVGGRVGEVDAPGDGPGRELQGSHQYRRCACARTK